MRVVKMLGVTAVCFALGLTLAGCSGSAESQAKNVEIVEKGSVFEPATVEVAVGDTVTFLNEDSVAHNVNIGGEDLGPQAQGESVTWEAEEPGSFPYSCTIHPSATGEVTVQ